MSIHAYHRLYYHMVWTTKNREPTIPSEKQECLKQEIEKNSSFRKGNVQAIAVLEDHVHLCVTLPPTVALSTFIGEVKGASSRAFNAESNNKIEWQRGYGIITIRKNDLPDVTAYIEKNAELHALKKGLSRTLERSEEPGESSNSAEEERSI